MSTPADRVRAVFDRAAELPAPADRAAFLDRACAGDTDLRNRVEALLRAYDEAGSFLEHPAAGLTATAVHVPGRPGEAGSHQEPEPIGSMIGPYRLLRQIGEGGMGTVFLAEQTEPVQREVALKVIKAGMDSRQVLARFEAERQALALMDHPNIARVLDAGGTPAGRPYFVMELVHGAPLTQYCDDHRLTPRDRLGLFTDVCRAVQHAHQKGVIHRDLKPTNVLVAEVDGRPVPKVIDFGVAKATEQRLAGRTPFTQHGTMVGTPEYMSPEQAEMTAEGVDTRSDIYSLGVLLYELLAGSTPLTHQRLKGAAYAEILRMIREEEPPRPSTRLSDSGEALASISARRHTEPARLTKLVRGELDWIVMKALEKDRNRRYETANGLAQDVQRYLADEPVQACPPSAGYRLGKFLRRNRGAVLATAVVLLALFGAGVGTAFGLVESRKQREVTSLWQQAEAARGEAVTARDGEATARQAAEAAREKLVAVEYGRTVQLAYQEWRENNVPATLALLESTRADLRGWEWRYVHRLCHSHLLALKGHSGVVSAAYSLDGSRLVTGGEDGTAKVWDARTGEELLSVKCHPRFIRSVAFSPDGTRVVSSGLDVLARVWDARTGAEILALKGHSSMVRSAVFSPDGRRVVTAGLDRTARVWDARTGAELVAFKGHAGGVASAAFSPDGSRVVTAGDTTARVWDADTGEQLVSLNGHTGDVMSAAFGPDGGRVVTGGRDHTARVWEVKGGAQALTLRGHTGDVVSVAFSPDGGRVVTGGHDRTARVWDAHTGEQLVTLKGQTGLVTSVAFSPDGARVVTCGDPEVRVWDARSGAESVILKGHTGVVRSAAFGGDGTRVVTGGADGTARVWDAKTGAAVLTLKGLTGVVPAVAISQDGARVATGNSGRSPKSWKAETGAPRVWDARTGAEIFSLKGHAADIWTVGFSPDGRRLVTGSEDRTAKVWDTQNGAEVLTLKGHTASVWSATFSPDGSRLVTASGDQTARVWDARTGAEALVLRGHLGRVDAAAFSPDGARVVTGSTDRTVRVWDAHTGAELQVLSGHTDGLTAVGFSPDGRRLVTGGADRTAKVWDARTGAEVLTLRGHTGNVYSVAFSPDGSRVVTAGDTAARVWDAGPRP